MEQVVEDTGNSYRAHEVNKQHRESTGVLSQEAPGKGTLSELPELPELPER